MDYFAIYSLRKMFNKQNVQNAKRSKRKILKQNVHMCKNYSAFRASGRQRSQSVIYANVPIFCTVFL